MLLFPSVVAADTDVVVVWTCTAAEGDLQDDAARTLLPGNDILLLGTHTADPWTHILLRAYMLLGSYILLEIYMLLGICAIAACITFLYYIVAAGDSLLCY